MITDALLDGSNRKAPNIAVLIFFIFSLLWMILGFIALAGVALAPESGLKNIAMGLFAALAAALLASRTQIAPIGATLLSALIMTAPYFVPSGPSLTAAASDDQTERFEAVAKAMATPPAQRDVGTITTSRTLKAKGYQEAPEIAKLDTDRAEHLKTWLQANLAAAQGMEEEMARQTTCSKYPSPQEYKKDLFLYVREPEAYNGSNRTWFALWIESARKLGYKDRDELTAADRESAINYTREWLTAHPTSLDAVYGVMRTYENPAQDDSMRPVEHASMTTLWIMLFAVGAAWSGRLAFTRPWQTDRFPGWAWEGMRRLIRKDRFAVARILGGLVAMGIVAALIVSLIAVHYNNRAVGKLIVALMVGAGTIVCSGLSFGEDESPRPQSGL